MNVRDLNRLPVIANRRSRTAIFIAILVLYLSAIVAVIGLHHEPWTDEGHFINTIHLFASQPGVDVMVSYPEVNPPLTFVLYAAFGRVAGMEPHSLRLLALVLSLLTSLCLFYLLEETIGSPLISLTAPLVLLANPYFIGISIFIYPDLPALLCAMLMLIAMRRNNVLGVFVAGACGLLFRQYVVFLSGAAILWYGMRFLHERKNTDLKMCFASVAAMIPLLILFLTWEGLAPRMGLERWDVPAGMAYHVSYVTTYLCCFTIYCFPVLIVRARHFIHPRRQQIILLAASFLYFIVPVRAPEFAIEAHPTVGLFHRALIALTGNTTVVHVIFYICFAVGLHVAWKFIADAGRRMRRKEYDLELFLDLAIICFLAVMPFSYQLWEKYFLLLLPFAMIRILLFGRDPAHASSRQHERRAASLP